MIYLFFLLSCIFCAIKFDGRPNGKAKSIFFKLLSLYLIFMAGLSYNLGGDSCTYRADFDNMGSINSWSDIISNISYYYFVKGYMPLWVFVNVIAKVIFNDFFGVQLILSFIVNSTFSYYIKKYSNFPFTCLAVLFVFSYCYLNFEIMRESFAICIGMWGVYRYVNGYKYSFYILLVVACLFHISAVCLILFPIIPKFTINIKILIVAFFISLVLYLIGDILMMSLPNLFNSSVFAERIVGYSLRTVSIFGFLRHSILYLFVPVLCYIILLRYHGDSYRFITRIMPFYVAIAVIATAFPGYSRWLNYFLPINVILIGDIIGCVFFSKSFHTYRVVAVFIILFAFVDKWNFYMRYYPEIHYHRYDLYFPYLSIFNDKEDTSYRDIIHVETLNQATDANYRDLK